MAVVLHGQYSYCKTYEMNTGVHDLQVYCICLFRIRMDVKLLFSFWRFRFSLLENDISDRGLLVVSPFT